MLEVNSKNVLCLLIKLHNKKVECDIMQYINRIIDKEIKDKLSYIGAVVIKGPKGIGKTTSAKQVAKSILEMQNPDLQDNYIELANVKPSLLLEGEKPRLIDEWQIVPKLWNAVRYSVDNIGLPG